VARLGLRFLHIHRAMDQLEVLEQRMGSGSASM
jgi:hypothetical protein